jgi:hypothetical protein
LTCARWTLTWLHGSNSTDFKNLAQTQRLLDGLEDRRPRPQRETDYRLGVSIV